MKYLRDRSPTRAQPQGFTVIEMLVVIFVVAILASIVIPRMYGASLRSREAKRDALIEILEDAVNHYDADYGSYPADLDDLTTTYRPGTTEPYLRELPTDPVTGRPFTVNAHTGKVSVSS